ncbi:MAG: thiamine-phosphate kinase [Dehalococcoidia bacterium]|nr:thiamine-phosphate kinase [Dehalococcoidia bacterium]
MNQKTISDYSEFQLIDKIIKKIPDFIQTDIIVNKGDDAAIFKPQANSLVVTSIDSFVENVHWNPSKQSYYHAGWKIINAAVSDIAAMGAHATYLTIACNLKKKLYYKDFVQLINGIRDACKELKINLIGGNLTSSNVNAITVSALGEIQKNNRNIKIMQRNNASIGDKILLSGPIGGAAAGRKLLKKEKINKTNNKMIKIFNQPKARTDIGEIIAQEGVKCAIDVSDGLLQDLLHICHASKVNAEIQLQEIPLYTEAIKTFGLTQAQKMALHGGEDYELLFTANNRTIDRLKRKYIPLHVIGSIKEINKKKQRSNISLIEKDKITLITKNHGWEHF